MFQISVDLWSEYCNICAGLIGNIGMLAFILAKSGRQEGALLQLAPFHLRTVREFLTSYPDHFNLQSSRDSLSPDKQFPGAVLHNLAPDWTGRIPLYNTVWCKWYLNTSWEQFSKQWDHAKFSWAIQKQTNSLLVTHAVVTDGFLLFLQTT